MVDKLALKDYQEERFNVPFDEIRAVRVTLFQNAWHKLPAHKGTPYVAVHSYRNAQGTFDVISRVQYESVD